MPLTEGEQNEKKSEDADQDRRKTQAWFSGEDEHAHREAIDRPSSEKGQKAPGGLNGPTDSAFVPCDVSAVFPRAPAAQLSLYPQLFGVCEGIDFPVGFLVWRLKSLPAHFAVPSFYPRPTL